ncbi:hypothetical protein P3X46_007918 [Hevea brasiliensis]|uniref:Protein kinase domain-containing protein n=1 Tax=Hevea brasiliensis TaxID=3981 RepID=A0ABQ9MYR4_HEVBR|nr:probable LRR receptor-like serine/threonine-protein kinase At3g47570 [Hevea brasiliensis]KAJ9184148.1 hypothetical protein P3X46_007918 [Hevea brasiliensis]
MAVFLPSSKFSIYAATLFLCFGSIVRAGDENDQLALLDIKAKITNDPLGVLGSWNSSSHFCQWYRVTCGKRHKRVTALDLRSLLLQGSISPHLGNLSFLRVLHLQNNSLSHDIPQEIGRLRRLQLLDIGYNMLTGEIPANISGCSDLVGLQLSFNRLIGRIPEDFSSLSKLRFLLIDNNNLTGGIPPSLGNLSSLEWLQTTINNFGGRIPETLGQLNNLNYISMGGNMLSGTVPSSIYNLSYMSVFCVPVNRLQGTIPSNLGNIFPNLVEFNIGDNKFTGSIPASLSNASNLERLTTAINGLTGNVPSLEKLHKLWWLSISTNYLGTGQEGDLSFFSSVSNSTSLVLCSISANNFGGLLPASITNFTGLSIMTLDANQISGSIPTGLGNLINLEMLDMGNNQLVGVIPEEIGKLQKLNKLNLHGNKLSGNIPPSLGNLTLLTYLNLHQNNLLGSIPPSLGKCQNLLSFTLNQNNLSGPIPREVVSISSLAIYMNLSQNYLTGSLPTEVGILKNLGIFDVSYNMLSGEIPSTLGSCTSLEYLYMQGNFFQGVIPASLSSLKGLQVLDFSLNNLTGTIPGFFEGFQLLQILNLSFNDLEGMVPKGGVFKNASAISVAGNSKLCGGIAEFQLPQCNFEETKKVKMALSMKLIIAASGALCVALALLSLFLLVAKRKRVEPTLRYSEDSHFQMPYQNLSKATEGFSSSNLLGVGSFGSVYKGILQDGKLVAVKVLNLVHPGASKSFKAECKVSRNVRHRNLVKLVTVCSSVDYQGNDFKALVYELMVNGNLNDWLYPMSITNGAKVSPRNLNFCRRSSIAIDVASAFEYLHHGYQSPIIHCDLKPSNVLLDDEMVGHVGDFGLARFFPEPTDSTSQSSTIGVRGSIGYTAPEYGMGNEVSTSGDVYSYGILLLEMFTGKRPTNEMFNDSFNLHNYTEAALPDKVEKILDPSIVQEIKEEMSSKDSHVVQECLILIFEIGVACSAELPSERMNITDVTAKLQTIKRRLSFK